MNIGAKLLLLVGFEKEEGDDLEASSGEEPELSAPELPVVLEDPLLPLEGLLSEPKSSAKPTISRSGIPEAGAGEAGEPGGDAAGGIRFGGRIPLSSLTPTNRAPQCGQLVMGGGAIPWPKTCLQPEQDHSRLMVFERPPPRAPGGRAGNPLPMPPCIPPIPPGIPVIPPGGVGVPGMPEIPPGFGIPGMPVIPPGVGIPGMPGGLPGNPPGGPAPPMGGRGIWENT